MSDSDSESESDDDDSRGSTTISTGLAGDVGVGTGEATFLLLTAVRRSGWRVCATTGASTDVVFSTGADGISSRATPGAGEGTAELIASGTEEAGECEPPWLSVLGTADGFRFSGAAFRLRGPRFFFCPKKDIVMLAPLTC